MIYFLEDDESIRKLVVYALESQGFAVEGFALPSVFHRAMERALPELVLLDIMLPEEGVGCTFCAACAPARPRGRSRLS